MGWKDIKIYNTFVFGDIGSASKRLFFTKITLQTISAQNIGKSGKPFGESLDLSFATVSLKIWTLSIHCKRHLLVPEAQKDSGKPNQAES